MASTTLTVMTPVITGTSNSTKSDVASSQTLTIQASTAQGALDMATLVVRVENVNTTTAVTLSLGVSTEYSDLGIGAASVSVGTATTVVIGGQLFESARFLTTSGTIIFTQTGTGPTTWSATQKPRASE